MITSALSKAIKLQQRLKACEADLFKANQELLIAQQKIKENDGLSATIIQLLAQIKSLEMERDSVKAELEIKKEEMKVTMQEK